MTISAQIIADSINSQGNRVTTMQITAHRWILAEINTHKDLSRNYRSSRAVPVKRLLQEVRENPAMPIAWLKNKPGMQATEPMTESMISSARQTWLQAARSAANNADILCRVMGLHKQWANRVIEPFLYVHGVITATEWANFYALRRHPDAQPEFRALADAMWEAQQASTPQLLRPGEWHLPYVDNTEDSPDFMALDNMIGEGGRGPADVDWMFPQAIKISAARCARVSYMTHDGKTPSIEADLKLYDQLVGSVPAHASPCEHQATPDTWLSIYPPGCWARPELHANLRGWISHRKFLPNEYVTAYTG